MPKITYVLASIMLCSILSYGQEITFHENVNYRANTLLQSLSKDQDSLFLESKTEQILKVDIFNDDYSESIDVYNHKAKIDLNILPIGSFVIQANVDKQWIIMYLEKNESKKTTPVDQDHNTRSKVASIHSRSRKEALKMTSSRKTEKHIKNHNVYHTKQPNGIVKDDTSIYYWVVYESNSSFGSSKTMRLEYKNDVDKLILKNKRELKSNVGKNNTLIIYEVYDKSKFMDKQFRNPAYYKTAEAAKFLNAEPLYATNDEVDGDYSP